jgi:molecular chaperone GrpE
MVAIGPPKIHLALAYTVRLSGDNRVEKMMTDKETPAPEDTDARQENDATASDQQAEAAGAQGGEAPTHEELTLLLEDARAKADEHWDQLLRTNAELDNARRRARQDVENAHKYALEKFALELLPVRDSLEMGLAAANGEGDAAARLREGTELTLKMLTAAMEKFGIKAVEPTGQPFDPELHQAMSMQESSDHTPNTVMAVMQKGYQLNDRLIRPAMVVVAKAAEKSPDAGQIDEKA